MESLNYRGSSIRGFEFISGLEQDFSGEEKRVQSIELVTFPKF
ncbi:hypothetical protein [Marivirga aurantiaca]|nr:hypothetical protein [Marivirga aurantiaca]